MKAFEGAESIQIFALAYLVDGDKESDTFSQGYLNTVIPDYLVSV